RRNFYVAEKIIRKLRGELPHMRLIVSDPRDIAPSRASRQPRESNPHAARIRAGDPASSLGTKSLHRPRQESTS
ncbi:MAG: hypothetical protein WCH13_18475, partial [Deltaproteobacteria bacterium]